MVLNEGLFSTILLDGSRLNEQGINREFEANASAVEYPQVCTRASTSVEKSLVGRSQNLSSSSSAAVSLNHLRRFRLVSLQAKD